MPQLNNIDAEIIRNLLREGRISYDELADKCRVSKNVAWKRYKSIEKRGIITGATVQINFSDFGFDALATLLISVDAQYLEQSMKIIKKISEVRTYRQYNTVYNIRAIATLRDLNELDHIKQIIKQKLPTNGLKTYIWTGVRNIPENLNLINITEEGIRKNKSSTSNSIKKIEQKPTIDELDKHIVAKLALKGRASFTEIAKQIGVSTDTVVKRYRKMRKRGSIKISIQINPNKIGYYSILDFNMAFSNLGGFTPTIVESLAKIQNIIIITKTSGEYDLQVTAMVRDITEWFAIQDKISRIHGITRMEVSARKIPDMWPTPYQYISTF